MCALQVWQHTTPVIFSAGAKCHIRGAEAVKTQETEHSCEVGASGAKTLKALVIHARNFNLFGNYTTMSCLNMFSSFPLNIVCFRKN